jgi:hypothetical protein
MAATRRLGTCLAVAITAVLAVRSVLTTGFTFFKGTWLPPMPPVDAGVVALPQADCVTAII